MQTTAFEGGLTNPVYQSQAIFRTLMDAMARPGSVHALSEAVAPPAGLNPVAGAVLLALADADTPVWLDPKAAASQVVKTWIAFHTGAPVTGERAGADFAVIADASQPVDLAGFAQGTQEYPDRSTTLIICVESLDGGDRLDLSGPGIRDLASIAPHPLPARFREQWRANGMRFPRGVDVIFAAADALAAMPRTTRILENGEA